MGNLLAKPLGDRVLIQSDTEQKTSGGIIIPDSARGGDHKIGTVVAVGDGLYSYSGVLIPMNVKVGDQVLLPVASAGSNQTVKLGDTNYLLFREQDLLLVLR